MSLIFDEIIKNTALEVKSKFGITLKEKDITEIYKRYLHTINRYLTIGEKNKVNTFAKRVIFEGIGYIILEVSRFRRWVERDRAETITLDKVSDAAYSLRMKGWYFVEWTEEKGYIFVNVKERIRYSLKRDTFYGLKGAYIYFNEICDSPLIRMGLDVLQLKDIKEAHIKIGEIVVYSKQEELIREYATLGEAASSTYFSASYIYKVLLYNWENQFMPKRIRDEYWFLKENYNKEAGFRATNVNVKFKDIVDLIDANTGEVVIRSIGTLSDAAEYINSLNGKWEWVKTNCLIPAYKKNRIRYGFRFRKGT